MNAWQCTNTFESNAKDLEIHVKPVFSEKSALAVRHLSTNGLKQCRWWNQIFTIVKWVFVNVSMELVDDDVNIVLSVQNAWKN